MITTADHVRLLLWSAGCLPGVHLPFFAAVADGLFAGYGLDVELRESPPGSERVERLAAGEGDFLLTATLYHLQALAERGRLPLRAIGALHQRNPIAAFVRADSGITCLAELAGRRLGAPVGTSMGWLAVELGASLRAAHAPEPRVVSMPYRDAYAVLARDEIDMVANFADLLPIDEQRMGRALRAIPAGGDVYASSVLAADTVVAEVRSRFVAAAAASFGRQREEPDRGVRELRARYPHVDAAVAVETWRRFEPFAFDPDGGAVSVDAESWEPTYRWIARTHALRLAV